MSLSSFTYWAPQGADNMVRWAPQGQVCIFNFTICIYSNTACIFNNTRIFIISAICSYFVNFISLLYIRLVSYYALLSHSNCEHIISSGFHFWWSCPLIVLFDTAPSWIGCISTYLDHKPSEVFIYLVIFSSREPDHWHIVLPYTNKLFKVLF